MTINYNPTIVTDGLVMCIDAMSSRSYDNTSIMKDLVKNTNVTLINNPTHNYSYISFNGTNQRGECSLAVAPTTTTTYEILFSMRSLPTGEYATNNHICGGEVGNNISLNLYPISGTTRIGVVYDDSRYAAEHASNKSIESGEWVHFIWLSNTGNQLTYYINGELDRPEFTAIDATAATLVWEFARDSRWSTYSELDLSLFRVYGRHLSDQEIKQNFEAVRGRFGL